MKILLLGWNGQVGWELQLSLAPLGELFDSVPTSAFPTPARRPHNSRLDCSRLEATFALTMPGWQRGVFRMLSEILLKD